MSEIVGMQNEKLFVVPPSIQSLVPVEMCILVRMHSHTHTERERERQGFSLSLTFWISTLNHKASHVAMKRRSVVVSTGT